MDRKHSRPILEPHEENRAASVDAEVFKVFTEVFKKLPSL